MKGTVRLRNDVKKPYWYVAWPAGSTKKEYIINKYPGEKEPMYLAHHDRKYDIGHIKATKLLHQMQADSERGVFNIQKYTGHRYTDVLEYLDEWLASKSGLTPAGYDKYRYIINRWLRPFFEENPVMLHEIQYDTLIRLIGYVKGGGKHRKNVVDTLRACMKFAWKSRRITEMPPFPEHSVYQIHQKPVLWLPSERQEAVINAIPVRHQPIFWFLKYHLRRPGEAIALHRADYNADLDAFMVQRGVSGSRIIERTKTGDVHVIPCHSKFKPFLKSILKAPSLSPYMFQHEESHSGGRRYTHKYLRQIWKAACLACNEDITLYAGTKHSTASQLFNEIGLSRSELQEAGDWSSIKSTESYARTSIAKRRNLLERARVISLKDKLKKER